MILIPLIILVVVALWLASTYNFFVTAKTRIGAAIQEIGNQLKRQADLIPNLEASVKGYMSHEKDVFKMLTDARKAVVAASTSGILKKIFNMAQSNFYEAISINKRKSLIIVIGFMFFVTLTIYVLSQAIGFYFGYAPGGLGIVGIAFIVSGVTSFIGYYYSDKVILTMSGARVADRKTDFQFYTVSQNMAL